MDREIYTLEKILELSKYPIFLDTGARGNAEYRTKFNEDILDHLWDKKSFDHIKKEVIEDEITLIENFMPILMSPKSATIKEVIKETEHFEESLKAKYNYLSNKKMKVNGRKTKDLYIKLCQFSGVMTHFYKKREWNSEDPRFELLGEMIHLLRKRLNLKKDFYDESEPSKTDSKLLAAAYYFSLSGIKPNVITSDYDLKILLSISYDLLGSSVFKPYNNSFRFAIKRKLPDIFLWRDRNSYELTSRCLKNHNLDDNFCIKNNPFLSEDTQEIIKEFWNKFTTCTQ